MPLSKQKSYTLEDYENLPEHVQAELIDGQFYNQAAPSRIHQEILSFLHVEISNYIREKKGGCKVYPAPFAVQLFMDRQTMVEPDLTVICDPKKLTSRGCSGAPDWIIEITSPSNSNMDYILKLNQYAAAGVREYWIVNPMKKTVFVYYLEKTEFEVEVYGFQDEIPSDVFPELRIRLDQID